MFKYPTKFSLRITYYFLSIIIVAFAISCNSSNNTTIEECSIDAIETEQLNIVDSIKMVQLETTPECLVNLNFFGKFIIENDRFYILDNKQQAIFCFDINGKFLFKINNKGRGPKEYSYISDIAIDKFNNRFIILEPFGKIHYYTLDGEFIKKVILSDEVTAYDKVFIPSKDTVVFLSNSDYQVIVYNISENKVLHKLLKRKYKYIANIQAYTYNNKVNLYHQYTNELSELNLYNGNITAKRFIDLGEYTIDTNKFESYDKASIEHIANVEKTKSRIPEINLLKRLPKIFISKWIETNRYIITTLIGNGLYVPCYIYDKINDEGAFVKHVLIKDVCIVIYSANNNILALGEVEARGKKIPYYNPDLLDAKNKAIADAHTDNMNPMLALYYLKK
jgi:hypothetical protein